MDVPSLINLLKQFLDAENWLALIVTVSGAITVAGTLIIYAVKFVKFLYTAFGPDPFGPKSPVGPRYQKFFQSLLRRLKRHDRVLVPPAAVGLGNLCTFSANGLTYYVHFVDGGTFRVYLKLAGANASNVFSGLSQKAEKFQKRFREPLVWDNASNLVIVNYPGGGAIANDARKLKKMRKWALARLHTMRTTFERPAQDIHDTLVPASVAQRA